MLLQLMLRLLHLKLPLLLLLSSGCVVLFCLCCTPLLLSVSRPNTPVESTQFLLHSILARHCHFCIAELVQFSCCWLAPVVLISPLIKRCVLRGTTMAVTVTVTAAAAAATRLVCCQHTHCRNHNQHRQHLSHFMLHYFDCEVLNLRPGTSLSLRDREVRMRKRSLSCQAATDGATV